MRIPDFLSQRVLGALREATLCERHRETAFADIVRRAKEASVCQLNKRLNECSLLFKITLGSIPGHESCPLIQILAATKTFIRIVRYSHGKQDNRIPFALEIGRDHFGDVLDKSDHADHGRWKDRTAGTLIIEAHVAAGDRRADR